MLNGDTEVSFVRGSVETPAGFQLRIELREVLPPVWRRFLVPGSITLPGLHRVIQEVMGWENYHLHLFRFGNKEYGIPDPEYPSEMRNDRGRRLREFLRYEGDVFGYVYDFGDNWEHDVVVERIVTGTFRRRGPERSPDGWRSISSCGERRSSGRTTPAIPSLR